MAFNLSQRVKSGRMADDDGAGFRGNTADFGVDFGSGDKGGVGDDSGSNKGAPQPHSSAGFKRVLMHTEKTQGRLSGAIASKTDFGGKGFRKPNYFGQGGRRHGMHIGAGSPPITPATDTGSDAGGN